MSTRVSLSLRLPECSWPGRLQTRFSATQESCPGCSPEPWNQRAVGQAVTKREPGLKGMDRCSPGHKKPFVLLSLGCHMSLRAGEEVSLAHGAGPRWRTEQDGDKESSRVAPACQPFPCERNSTVQTCPLPLVMLSAEQRGWHGSRCPPPLPDPSSRQRVPDEWLLVWAGHTEQASRNEGV